MHSHAFNHSLLLTQFGGDLEFANEIIELFLEESPQLLAVLRDAVERRDAKAIERSAHRLKASAGKFGRNATVAGALQLEVLGRKEELENSDAAFQMLRGELQLLRAELAAWIEAEATAVFYTSRGRD